MKSGKKLLVLGLVVAYMCMAVACSTNDDKATDHSGSMAGTGATTETGMNGTDNNTGTNGTNATNGTTGTVDGVNKDTTNGTHNGDSVLDDAGNAVGNAVDDAGNAVGNVVDDVADGVSDITNDIVGGNGTTNATTSNR